MSTKSEPASLAKTLAEEVLASSPEVSPVTQIAHPAKTASEGDTMPPEEPAIINAHPYFTTDNWPKVEGLVKGALREKGFESFVDVTTRNNRSQTPDPEITKPVISIRYIPEKEDGDAFELKKAINDRLATHGFKQQVDIFFEPGKRVVRHVPPPIDTKRTHKKEASSLGLQISPFPQLSPTEQETGAQVPKLDVPSLQGKLSGKNNSVKHLTCWYWLNRGICKKSDLECAYSHFDTGKYADKPLPLIPGSAAVAGKNATRIQANLDQTGHIRTASYPPGIHQLGLAHQAQPIQSQQAIINTQNLPFLNVNNHSHHVSYGGYSAIRAPPQAPIQLLPPPPYSAPLGLTQAPLTPLSGMPPKDSRFASRDIRLTESTHDRRLTVGAGRPKSDASGTPTPAEVDRTADAGLNRENVASTSGPVQTPSTGTMGPNSAALSGPLSAALSTPATGQSFNNSGSSNSSNSIAACRELCSALDTNVACLNEMNKQLAALGYKYPSVHVQMGPLFDTISRSLNVSVQRRANAQMYMRDDPLFPIVFGNAENASNTVDHTRK